MLAELQFGTIPSYVNNRDWFSGYARQVVLLQHPTLLRVVDVCVDERDQWVLIREALPGRWHWLYDRRVLDDRNQLETISSILLSASEALSYLHQVKFRGINFSPWHESARITYLPDGELHFGMAPPTPRDAYLRPEMYKYEGCTAYSAPEALGFHDAPKKFVYHPPTLATDSFSLGCLFFELLTGKALFGESTGRRLISDTDINSEIRQKLSPESTVSRDIHPHLRSQLGDFINQALAESPEARPSLKEWAVMMEGLGGRLLMPPPLTELAPQSEGAIQSGTLSLFSVLEGALKKQKVDLLAPLGGPDMGWEYLVEISSVVPNDAELTLISPPEPPASGPSYRPHEFDDNSAAIIDQDEPTVSTPTTQPLSPPHADEASTIGPTEEDEIPTKPLSPQALSTGALSAASISDDTFGEPAAVNTGALPADFVAQPETPIYLDENVQFTVYRPKAILPQKWYSLLAFAHLSEKREDAPEDEPDPVAEVRQQAQRILGKQAADYQNLTQDTLQAIPREGVITFVPTMPGIEFNPPSRSFVWEESVHREDFRLRAESRKHVGRVLKGRLSVFLGSILLADIPLSMRVDNQVSTRPGKSLEETHARPYRKIFASYSHRDIEVVEQFERFAEALGDRYLRDVRYLRSGEMWNEKLEEMIVEADIFQLFWSSNSMHSPFVRQEWEYALSLQRPNFIRPTYWEEPLPTQWEKRLPPEELMRLHFQRIRSGDSQRLSAHQTQGQVPLAAAPEDADEKQSAARDSQRSGRAQSRDRLAASKGSAERVTLIRETPSPPPRPQVPSLDPDDLLGSFRPLATPPRGVGASESPSNEDSHLERMRRLADSMGGGGIGSSGRRGVGGSYSDRSASRITVPSAHRPPAAPPPPAASMSESYSQSIEYSGRSGSGQRLDFGDAPKSNARFVPLLIVLGLALFVIISVILFFALR